jgi:hypothetical protein
MTDEMILRLIEANEELAAEIMALRKILESVIEPPSQYGMPAHVRSEAPRVKTH